MGRCANVNDVVFLQKTQGSLTKFYLSCYRLVRSIKVYSPFQIHYHLIKYTILHLFLSSNLPTKTRGKRNLLADCSNRTEEAMVVL